MVCVSLTLLVQGLGGGALSDTSPLHVHKILPEWRSKIDLYDTNFGHNDFLPMSTIVGDNKPERWSDLIIAKQCGQNPHPCTVRITCT